MKPPILHDPKIFPTERVIASHIGASKTYWDTLFTHIHNDLPELKEEWRYYNDGKSWLMKATRKTKTMFWLGVVDGAFRVTFYFTDKASEALKQSSISQALKKQFYEGKYYNKIRGITVMVKSKRSVEDVRRLLEMKLALK